MRLTVDLIPQTAFFQNLRNELPPKQWDIIRRACYQKADNKCEICGGRGKQHPVEAHEVWNFNEITEIQSLVGIMALCPMCHAAKHILLAKKQGRYFPVLKHLAKVNGITMQAAEQHVVEEFMLWQKRSQIKWSLDISMLDNIKRDLQQEERT